MRQRDADSRSSVSVSFSCRLACRPSNCAALHSKHPHSFIDQVTSPNAARIGSAVRRLRLRQPKDPAASVRAECETCHGQLL
ncbi:hypothetical protein PHBOTO_006244 [Pseudozyma hubeiensis]|nr:hypothetical protein PHBOTO_006244 [Pseudozyma hubeiensis]